MASLGHIAIGMTAARLADRAPAATVSAFACWSAVSLLPDLDVIGFSFGVRYADPWGHRGATHSLAIAALVGVAGALVARRFDKPPLRTGIMIALVLASHAGLDTMTDGGLGCALFWPFDHTRYFAPWRPIPVAPIGFGFLSPAGAAIAVTELVLFAPLLVFALWRPGIQVSRIAAACLIALWTGSVWLLVSSDPLRESVVGLMAREDTAYSHRYSEREFRGIARGDSQAHVIERLGAPLRQIWFYDPAGQRRGADVPAAEVADQCVTATFDGDSLIAALAQAPCAKRGIQPGISTNAVERLLGEPSQSCWSYTSSPGNRRYRIRAVCFVGGRVDEIVRRWE
jgi:inner membrane protein